MAMGQLFHPWNQTSHTGKMKQSCLDLEVGTSFTLVLDLCHSGGLIDKHKEQIGPSRVRDMDLRCLIKDLEVGTSFTLVSDSCHSGGLIDKHKEQIGPSRVRGIPPPVHFKARSIPVETVAECLLSTRSNLTATEDVIGGRPKFWGIAIRPLRDF
ncbi:hypothetical protein GQ457_05G033120 [Hibiscus cannabinus]